MAKLSLSNFLPSVKKLSLERCAVEAPGKDTDMGLQFPLIHPSSQSRKAGTAELHSRIVESGAQSCRLGEKKVDSNYTTEKVDSFGFCNQVIPIFPDLIYKRQLKLRNFADVNSFHGGISLRNKYDAGAEHNKEEVALKTYRHKGRGWQSSMGCS